MIALAASQCYDQNGVTTTDTACDSGSLPTFCCPSGYSCLSNGLCGKGNSLQMGSCSDQAWSGGSCVKYCPSGSNNIFVCKPQSKGNYCCGTGQSCCSGQDVFQLGVLAQVSTLPFTTLTASTSSATKAATTISSSTLSSSISVTTTTAALTNPTGSPTAVPTSGAGNSPSTGGMKTGAKIGTAIGVIGGFAIIGFLVYFLIFLLKRRKQEKYNAERVAQIQAKVGRTFSSDNTSNGSFARLGSMGGAAAFDIPRTATPNSRTESMTRPLPPIPLQYDTQESYEPYRHLSRSLTHELLHLEPLAIAQHTQLPSHYSFSGPPVTVTSPVSPTATEAPPQRTTPVQEFAAAQLPSHFSFSGPPVMSPISPIEGSNEPPPLPSLTPIQQVTSPISPVEGSNEPPPRLTPVQQYAAAQLPSHFSFSGPPPPVTNPASPIEDPTRRPAGIQEMAAAQLPSHYSFSGPPSGSARLVDIPARKMTPAQELASARLRSNMSPMGLAGMDD